MLWFDPASITDSRFFESLANWTRSDPNQIVIAAHGNYYSVHDNRDGSSIEYRPEALASLIKKLPNFKTTTSVLFLACATGMTDYFASEMSRLLNKPVIVPKGWVYFRPNGRIYVALPKADGTPGAFSVWRTVGNEKK